MNKIKYIFSALIVIITLLSCEEDEIVDINEIITIEASPNNVLADGSTKIELIGYPNNDASSGKRNIVFTTKKGVFIENGMKTITKEATRLNGRLQSRVELLAPSTLGDFEITGEVDVQDLKGFYVAKKEIIVNPSNVAKIVMKVDSFSVPNNFRGEINIMASLLNEKNGGVTEGVQVLFEDLKNDLTTPVNGAYRNLMLTSGSNSTVSATYSPGLITAGQFIYIKGTVLDSNGAKTTIKDSVKIYVN